MVLVSSAGQPLGMHPALAPSPSTRPADNEMYDRGPRSGRSGRSGRKRARRRSRCAGRASRSGGVGPRGRPPRHPRRRAAARARGRKAAPAGVSSTRRVVRSKSWQPRSFSSCRTVLESAGCATNSRSAARPKCSYSPARRSNGGGGAPPGQRAARVVCAAGLISAGGPTGVASVIPRRFGSTQPETGPSDRSPAKSSGRSCGGARGTRPGHAACADRHAGRS
jgi:hypothetical protein